jgi:hypothetical protein
VKFEYEQLKADMLVLWNHQFSSTPSVSHPHGFPFSRPLQGYKLDISFPFIKAIVLAQRKRKEKGTLS